MKWTGIALVLALAPAAFAAELGVRAGRYNDSHENFVGAELVFDIGAVNINPNIEYSLEDNVTAGSANLDFTFDFGKFSRVTPYVGAGVGLSYYDADTGNDTSNFLGNVIGGVQFDLGTLKPYGQVKYFRVLNDSDDEDAEDDVALTIGLRF